MKRNETGWIGKCFEGDAVLGYRATPGATCEQMLSDGEKTPVKFSAGGFRIAVSGEENRLARPYAMSLGCSFTFGDFVPAEKTFTSIIGHDYAGMAINAGVSGAGIARMLLEADSLFKRYKPEYAIVQYSPWLVDRSMTEFAPTYAGMAPSPYFYNTDKGELRIGSPVFDAKIFSLNPGRFRNTDKSAIDFLRFLSEVGFPLFTHDDARYAVFRLKRIFNILPAPATDRGGIIRYAYGEFENKCSANGAKMIVLAIGDGTPGDLPGLDAIRNIKGVLIVDAQKALYSRLKTKTQSEYMKVYGHWGGSPPRLLDIHPNERAHEIIAEEVFKTIHADGRMEPGD